MYTFDIEYTQITTNLQTDTFNNLCRQEQMGEKIWHLEKRVMEQRVEGTDHGTCIVSAIASTPSIVSKILMAASKLCSHAGLY